MKKEDVKTSALKTKAGVFTGTEGKLRLGAMIAFIASFVFYFVPIDFLIHQLGENMAYPNNTVCYLAGAISSSSGVVRNDNLMIYIAILTLIALAGAIIVCIRKSPWFAIIAGAVAMITFVVLLTSVPYSFRNEYNTFGWEVTVEPGAFIAPIADFIGMALSLAAVLINRKMK